MNKIDTCENCINFFIRNAVFTGETGDAVKSYLTDVHITMLSSIRVTAQNLLDNMTLYKAGYYDIDNSTNFKLSEEAIRAFRTKLSTNYSDTESYTGKIQGAVSGISDISGVGTPSTNGVLELHEQLDQELLNLITEVQNHESSTVTALENSVELLLSSLNTCIAKIGLNTAAIASYESNSFYTDKDVYALANISELFYQQHEDNKDVYDAICEAEQNLKDAAEERETQGVWKTVGGVVLVGVGVACIIATAGAASPIVAAVGVAVGTGTTIFGAADSAEGAQDIYYGSIGDIDSTAVNDLKDVVFQGNEEAYYLTESVFAFAASAMIPIGQAASAGNLTFRSGATIVAKEGIATAAGAGAQKYTTDLTGNQTAGMIAGMAASMATAKGLNGIEAGAKKLAKPKLGDVGADGGAVLNDADVGSGVKSGSPTQGYSNFADGMSPEDATGYVLNNEKAFFNEFSERASAAGLSDTQIAEAFDAMRNGDYAKMATYFDTSSPVDGAVFWSGNKEGAAAYANSIGGTIMEQTPGGQVFDNWRGVGGMYPEWDTPTNLAQKPIWDALSSQYANGAEGIATYAHPDGYVGKVWSNIEKPILEENDIIIQEVIIDAK
ncbi:T7SS effector LXG polymorphic toxin [Roseburia sp. 831b]|uniref:T7SS effector LXG polymorphic toxin n=1 Tax=Roseburia sp. 831b TaxID=1261635 RepID=UPI0009530DA5|nr:T7SS effector LXG polymorphic toxin [Roseburia sp. 831b]WVK73175.1 T7SS effector LXG polymorphic toxin [Roseburia sp. 831b]